MEKTLIRSAYNRPYKQKKIDPGKSSTQQHDVSDSNINNIVKRHKQTGILGTGLGTRKPQFGNYTNIDYQEMQNKVAEVHDEFMSLPSEIRTRFENTPAKLLEFISDEKNLEEAIEMGFIEGVSPSPEKKPDSGTPEPDEADKEASKESVKTQNGSADKRTE